MPTTPVPATRAGRAWRFGTLAARVASDVMSRRVPITAASQSHAAAVSAASSSSTPPVETETVLSGATARQVAEALSELRGAALKMGQMLAMQPGIMPLSEQRALERMRHKADYMPEQQLRDTVEGQLGPGAMDRLDIDAAPFAAASIGQVHRARGGAVAVKVQYPVRCVRSGASCARRG